MSFAHVLAAAAVERHGRRDRCSPAVDVHHHARLIRQLNGRRGGGGADDSVAALIAVVEAHAELQWTGALIDDVHLEVADDAARGGADADEQVLDAGFHGEVARSVRGDEQPDFRQVEASPRLVESELRQHVGRRRLVREIERARTEREADALRRTDERVRRIHPDQLGDGDVADVEPLAPPTTASR